MKKNNLLIICNDYDFSQLNDIKIKFSNDFKNKNLNLSIWNFKNNLFFEFKINDKQQIEKSLNFLDIRERYKDYHLIFLEKNMFFFDLFPSFLHWNELSKETSYKFDYCFFNNNKFFILKPEIQSSFEINQKMFHKNKTYISNLIFSYQIWKEIENIEDIFNHFEIENYKGTFKIIESFVCFQKISDLKEITLNIFNDTCNINSHIYELMDIQSICKKIINADILSWDIFDTLLVRKTLYPEQIFHFLEIEYNKKFKNLSKKIYQMRRFAQIDLESNGDMTCTIDDIYLNLKKIFSLDDKEINFLKETEINLEKNYLEPKRSVLDFYYFSLFKNKKNIFVSDMYLNEKYLRKIIEDKGINISETDFFVSSDCKKTKRDGDIFDFLNNQHQNKKILHFGDNYEFDFINSQKKGWESIHISSALNIFNTLNLDHFIDNHWLTKYISYTNFLGFLVYKYLNNPFVKWNKNIFVNSIDFFSIFVFSYFLYKLSLWVVNTVIDYKDEVLYLIARDGWMINRTISEIFKETRIHFKYLPFSRRIYFPFFFYKEDMWSNFLYFSNIDKYHLRTLGVYVGTFSLEKFLVESVGLKDLSIIDFNEWTIKPNETIWTIEQIVYVRNKLKENKEVWNLLKINSDNIEKYFSNEISKKKSSVFDIGSHNNERLFFNSINKVLNGIYIFRENDNLSIYNHLNSSKSKIYFDFETFFRWEIMEDFLSKAEENSAISINDKLEIVREKEGFDLKTKQLISYSQNKTILVLKDFVNQTNDYEDFLSSSGYWDSYIFIKYISDKTFLKNNFILSKYISLNYPEVLTTEVVKKKNWKEKVYLKYISNDKNNNKLIKFLFKVYKYVFK